MIPVQTLLTVISVCAAVIFGFIAMQRNNKTDLKDELEERVSMNVMLNTKLDNMNESLNEIKRDNKETKLTIESLNERLMLVEFKTGIVPDRKNGNEQNMV